MARSAAKAQYEICAGACEPHEQEEVTAERRFDVPCEEHLAVKDEAPGTSHFCIKCGAPLGT